MVRVAPFSDSRCRIFNDHFSANLLLSLLMKEFEKNFCTLLVQNFFFNFFPSLKLSFGVWESGVWIPI